MGRQYFKRIAKGEWVKNGFNVVKAIIPFAQYAQTQIDLCIGKYDHVK
mgnify:CR=1 FL=1